MFQPSLVPSLFDTNDEKCKEYDTNYPAPNRDANNGGSRNAFVLFHAGSMLWIRNSDLVLGEQSAVQPNYHAVSWSLSTSCLETSKDYKSISHDLLLMMAYETYSSKDTTPHYFA